MEPEDTTANKKDKATAISHEVADVLIKQRKARGMSQRMFADFIGVSFQQYQKYEKGKDRISLEKAMILCAKLDLSLDIFLEDMDLPVAGFSETAQQAFDTVASFTPEQQEILDIYESIPEKSRKDFLEMLRNMARMASGKN